MNTSSHEGEPMGGGNIKTIETPPNQHAIAALENALQEARSGNLINVAIVGNLKDDSTVLRNVGFRDRLSLVGALEFAKGALCADDD